MERLQLTDEIKSFLDNDEKYIWDAILEGKTDQLPQTHPNEEADESAILFHNMVLELFAGNTDKLKEHTFLTDKNVPQSSVYKNFVLLLLTLDIADKYAGVYDILGEKLRHSAQILAEGIDKESNGYPKNPIGGDVWMEGAGVRAALNLLLYYYKQKQNTEPQLEAAYYRTRITLSIMGHYKNLVGPDMLETAHLFEKQGDLKRAKGFFEAVKNDFERELDWFMDSPEVGADEDERIILKSLKEAYENIDRINSTNDFAERCKLIDEVLARKYTPFEMDEDDEEED